jgi:methyl-accepting chemotaxis protein
MKYTILSIAGVALVAAGIAGLVFCVLGIVVLGQVQNRIEAFATEQLAVTNQALSATSEGLALAETALSQTAGAVSTLEGTIRTISQSVDDTQPTLEAIALFLGEELPAMIDSTQETLRGAATSAQLIDDFLYFVSSIPLLGTSKYNPEVPLHQGLADVADSLDQIPVSLGLAEEGLGAAGANLETLGRDFAQMADDIGQVGTSLEQAQPILAEYQAVVGDLTTLIDSINQGLPRWLGWLRLGLSLALVWLGIAQIALITQGGELVARSRALGNKPV